MYHNKSLELDGTLETKLKDVLDGSKKVINSLKKRGLMKVVNQFKKEMATSLPDNVSVKEISELREHCRRWSGSCVSARPYKSSS
ncbi:hypothetical protein P3T76_004436 [Phytophthora citrophthora]|uniref:Uncharacterized protein n=1 Tax=Phytophthora citrophthora TaxID=4793 RepID=A0AAD9GTV5_9STRA|nr:hypothetical protein P3T76_004436 [Phytophthora citrophthora]